MSDREKLKQIDAIMEKAREQLKNYVRNGMSTDLRERLSLQDIKSIAALARQKGTRK